MPLIRLRASSTDRYIDCPGAYRASVGIVQEDTKQAEEGHIDHAAIAETFEKKLKADDLGLDGRDRYIVDEFRRKTIITAAQYVGLNKTVWCGHEEPIVPPDWVWKGTSDFYATGGEDAPTMLVIDYKTGRLPQSPAWEHGQLRTYAVGLWLQANREPITVDAWLFCAGNPPQTRYTKVSLNTPDLERSEAQLRQIYDAVMADNAPRNPTERACKYCPAAGNPDRCPENCETIRALTLPGECATVALTEINSLMTAWKSVKQRGEALEKYIRARLAEDGIALDDWELGKPRIQKEITDAKQAFFALLNEIGHDNESAAQAFLGCCKPSIPQLQDAVYTYRKARDEKFTKKRAKEVVTERLGALIAEKQGNAPLQKKKGEQ